MKYEATVSCIPLWDSTAGIVQSKKTFDSLFSCLSEVVSTFDVDPADIKVVDGKWQFNLVFNVALIHSDVPDGFGGHHRVYQYTVDVRRIDPVLPSELKRELEKLC